MLWVLLSLWAGLSPGRFHAGYRHVDGVDLWYPSKTDGASMHFRDYLGADARGLSSQATESFLGAHVYATRDAIAAKGRYPLVLIAQGNGQDAADQAVLAEFLASHGYVVASVPSPMKKHPMTDESQIGAFAEEQARALERARVVASRAVRIQKKRQAVIGHSFGARAALLLAARDRNIRAVVSLDGGIGTATGNQYLQFDHHAPLPPLLHIYEELDPFMKPDFTFLKELRTASLTTTPTAGMHHIHFTTYGFAAAAIAEVATVTKAGPQVRENVAGTARLVLTFLDDHLSK
jgi:Dienelactone hydrolase and related enzymes